MQTGIPVRRGGTEGTEGAPSPDLGGSLETRLGEPDMLHLWWGTQPGNWGFWEAVAVVAMAPCGAEDG